MKIEACSKIMTKEKEKNKGGSRGNNILAWVWCACKLLCNYIQFILHGQLVSQVLHNGVKRMREKISCHKPVHMWCVWRSASVQMRLAEMRWLHRGRDIDNWGLQAMLPPVESILGQVEYKCRLCLESSWNGKAFCLERGSWRFKHWKCIRGSLKLLSYRAACHQNKVGY